MTRVYFVRHALPDFQWKEDSTRPLTPEGLQDAEGLVKFFKEIPVNVFYSSPYKRSVDTIEPTARFHNKEIYFKPGLRERQGGQGSNNREMFEKRWQDKHFHEPEGESLFMVQERNMQALSEILAGHRDQVIVVGTHGTALSTILHHYEPAFNCDSFLRIINWMPYIIELVFDGDQFLEKKEHLYMEKPFVK